MKIGDLVSIKNEVMYGGAYGIIVSLHWHGDTSMVTVVLSGDTIFIPFYIHELEVVNGKRN